MPGEEQCFTFPDKCYTNTRLMELNQALPYGVGDDRLERRLFSGGPNDRLCLRMGQFGRQ
jgi:hypothetical protein